MKSVKILNNKKLLVQFKSKDKNEFFKILNKIKALPTEKRRFDNNLKCWFLKNDEQCNNLLDELGFEVTTVEIKQEFSIELTNSIIFISNCVDDLLILQQEFVFDDYSYCYVGGRFDKSKIKKRTLLEIKENIGILPIGFIQELTKILTKNNIKYFIKDNRKFEEIKISDDIIKNNLHYLELYDYQIEAVKSCIENKNGIIKLPTSAGKTEIFLSLCNILNIKTLILFSRIDLAKQTKDRAIKANLDTGIVQGNNIDEEHNIIMCTIQSAHKLQNKYDMVIVDECHRNQAKQYQKLLSNRNFKFRFGFSATPFTKDKYKTALTKRWLGDIIYELPATELLDSGKIAEPIIKIIVVHKPISIQFCDWRNAEKLGIVSNEYRNELIANIIKEETGAFLVLVKKLKQGKLLEKIIPNAIFLNGNTDVDTRKKVAEDFENNKNITIIASTIFDEGISLNNIRNLIIAGGGKSEIKTIQRLGRGLRIKEDKDTVNVFDFYDYTNYFLEKHSAERIKTYQKEGFTNITILNK